MTDRSTREDGTQHGVQWNSPIPSLVVLPQAQGFGSTWTLYVTFRGQTSIFYLGQDAKVLHRLLGTEAAELARLLQIGYPINMEDPRTLRALADHLLAYLVGLYDGEGDPVEVLMGMEPWTFSVE